MAEFQFKLPDIGEGIAEAEIVAWHVKVGDTVKEDQPIVDMMTDKATVELSSPVEGVVQSLAGKVGDKTAVGKMLITFETGAGGAATKAAPAPKADAAPAPKKAEPAPAPKAAAPAPKPVVHENHATPAGQPAMAKEAPRPAARASNARPAAAPAVRRRAEELGIKLQYVAPTGPQGRITHADLDAFVQNGSVPAGRASSVGVPLTAVDDVPVIGLRRQIAERMQLSKRHIPHFSYVEEVDVTALEDLRAHLNTDKSRTKLTLLPFFMTAMVRAMPDFPQINALYDDEAGVVHRHAGVHVGIATQTKNGLMVAVVRHAEARDLWDMADEVLRVSSAAREGKAKREELTGSTITLTSLGTLGGIASTPVINRPEVAIINPNKIVERPVVRHGQIAVRKMMNLSSSFDHRVVDGADGANFIQRMKVLLEQPALLFMA